MTLACLWGRWVGVLCCPLPFAAAQLASSAGIFYGYIFVIGLLLYFLVKWFKGELRIVNVICVYGE